MRLVEIHIQGYKRLVDSRTHIPGKMTALLGPNEAGKSSVLESLLLLSSDESVPPWHRSRALSPSDRQNSELAVVTADFDLVDPEDLDGLDDLDLVKPPQNLTIDRLVGGRLETTFDPEPQYAIPDIRPLKESLAKVEFWLRSQDDFPESAEWTPQHSIPHVTSLLNQIDSPDWDHLHSLDWSVIAEAIVSAQTNGCDDAASALTDFQVWRDWAEQESAEDACWERIQQQVPLFKHFDAAARTLQSEYDINDGVLINPPVSLANLFALAGLDSVALSNDFGDISTRASHIKKANTLLTEVFRKSWKQGHLSVAFHIDGSLIRLMITDHEIDAESVFQERSDGLKTFVALVAFLNTSKGQPAILLIDEAEQHLHYDAQADLVDTLMNQDLASQVILTTHSPGCLPRDLGSGIRFVQKMDNERSVIRHDFWSMGDDEVGPGFSPMLMAMGAGAAAFSAVRKVVVAEGPSDMLLLPTLLRMATKQETLSYQVTQGLAAAAPSDYGRLDKVAPHVCYVVDGDGAGDDYRAELELKGVNSGRIFQLPEGCAVEDLINADDYIAAFNRALRRLGQTSDVITVADISTGLAKIEAKKWCEARDTWNPSPVLVAEILLDPAKPLRLTTDGESALSALEEALSKAMDEA